VRFNDIVEVEEGFFKPLVPTVCSVSVCVLLWFCDVCRLMDGNPSMCFAGLDRSLEHVVYCNCASGVAWVADGQCLMPDRHFSVPIESCVPFNGGMDAA
jgi:hypothetical protein